MAKGECSICGAGEAAKKAAEEAIGKKEPYRDIEKRSGFSRAALSRHKRKCMPRAVLAETKFWRRSGQPAANRVIVFWPDHRLVVHNSGKSISIDDLVENDIVVIVEYAPAPKPAEPAPENSAAPVVQNTPNPA